MQQACCGCCGEYEFQWKDEETYRQKQNKTPQTRYFPGSAYNFIFTIKYPERGQLNPELPPGAYARVMFYASTQSIHSTLFTIFYSKQNRHATIRARQSLPVERSNGFPSFPRVLFAGRIVFHCRRECHEYGLCHRWPDNERQNPLSGVYLPIFYVHLLLCRELLVLLLLRLFRNGRVPTHGQDPEDRHVVLPVLLHPMR